MATQPIFEFYAELGDYKPKMWRRFQIANNITMARLGYIVMTLFEMQASHLFRFDVPVNENYRKCFAEFTEDVEDNKVIDLYSRRPELAKLHVEIIDEDDFSEFEGQTLGAAQTKVNYVLYHETETMTFLYDYGDGWEITLTLEKIIKNSELRGKDLPRVIKGEGFGIVEDCGGSVGLKEIAKAFKKKKGSQYKEYCEWLGTEDLDLAAFDINDMNFRLKKLPRIFADAYEYNLEPTKQSMDLLERKYKKT